MVSIQGINLGQNIRISAGTTMQEDVLTVVVANLNIAVLFVINLDMVRTSVVKPILEGDWIILTITKMVMVKGVGHPEIQEVVAAKTGMIIKTTTIISIRVAIQIGKVAIRIIIGNKIG